MWCVFYPQGIKTPSPSGKQPYHFILIHVILIFFPSRIKLAEKIDNRTKTSGSRVLQIDFMFFPSLQTKTSPWTLMKTRWVSTVEDLVGWEDPLGPIRCDPTPSQPSLALCFGRGPCHVMEACSSFSTWTWRSFWPRMGWGCTAMGLVPLAPRSHHRQVWRSGGSQFFFFFHTKSPEKTLRYSTNW